MRTRGVVFGLAALACVGLCLVALKPIAGAQKSGDAQKPAAAAPGADVRYRDGGDQQKPESALPGADVRFHDSDDNQKPDGAAPGPDSQNQDRDRADNSRLRSDLDKLLRERADLDRRIDRLRSRLGENGHTHRQFQFRNGDGKPQTFEFDGGDMSKLSPQIRKQVEEAMKSAHDALGSMHFEDFDFSDMPNFDFHFDGKNGVNGPEMKRFQERMEKWAQKFSDRMQRRNKDRTDKDRSEKSNKSGKGDESDKDDESEDSGKSTTTKINTVDA